MSIGILREAECSTINGDKGTVVGSVAKSANVTANSTTNGICCAEHYLGECIQGEDDQPGGYCYELCIQHCRGAICKHTIRFHCHCLC
ncbi:hypothetical protein LINPERPRIM_LOCUS1448 [Linum perenne]